jgi:hypothetical protein
MYSAGVSNVSNMICARPKDRWQARPPARGENRRSAGGGRLQARQHACLPSHLRHPLAVGLWVHGRLCQQHWVVLQVWWRWRCGVAALCAAWLVMAAAPPLAPGPRHSSTGTPALPAPPPAPSPSASTQRQHPAPAPAAPAAAHPRVHLQQLPGVLPDALHVVPVGDDAVLDGVPAGGRAAGRGARGYVGGRGVRAAMQADGVRALMGAQRGASASSGSGGTPGCVWYWVICSGVWSVGGGGWQGSRAGRPQGPGSWRPHLSVMMPLWDCAASPTSSSCAATRAAGHGGCRRESPVSRGVHGSPAHLAGLHELDVVGALVAHHAGEYGRGRVVAGEPRLRPKYDEI